ncbi:deoxyribonuclease IV [Candidatus Woesebacteria bacterium]|nr:deoxyribonuclease IV [Candidatus Woesebacteria bacterium]
MATPRLIGAHVSAQGGIANAPKRAADIGCNYVQIFSDSPRVWQRRMVTDENCALFVKNCEDNGILGNVIHALYLNNLASDKPELVEKSIMSLAFDLQLAPKIKSTGVVVHVGSYSKRDWNSCSDQVVKNMATLLEQSPDDSVFLIENSAGQGGKVGSDLREIKTMIDQLQAGKRVGVCIDSCHAFAAGYSLVPMEGEKLLYDWLEQLNLVEHLRVLHVNDSRDEYFSHKDRHANINDGQIGTESLAHFVNHPMFANLPIVLEVPGIEGEGPDQENINRLKALLT